MNSFRYVPNARARRRVHLGIGLAAFLNAGAGLAYCPARTCNDEQSVCGQGADGCVSEGGQLKHADGCIAFGVGNGQAATLGLPASVYLKTIERAFSRWVDAVCEDGRHPGLAILSQGIVEANDSYYCPVASRNLSVWTVPKAWPLSPASLGFTEQKYDLDTFEIYDSDVILNAERLLWHEQEFELSPQAFTQLLLAVATHEAGHVLGLGHSEGADSVMAVRYRGGQIESQELSPDDVAGICALFPPDALPTSCEWPTPPLVALEEDDCQPWLDAQTEEELPSCSMGRPLGAEPGGALTILGALLLSLRRARPPRPSLLRP